MNIYCHFLLCSSLILTSHLLYYYSLMDMSNVYCVIQHIAPKGPQSSDCDYTNRWNRWNRYTCMPTHYYSYWANILDCVAIRVYLSALMTIRSSWMLWNHIQKSVADLPSGRKAIKWDGQIGQWKFTVGQFLLYNDIYKVGAIRAKIFWT